MLPRLATATVIALLALAPASAQAGVEANAATVTGETGLFSLLLNDDFPHRNRMALVTFTPDGGSTDLVIGDVAAGIDDPIPSICFRVDPNIIRCPLSTIHDVNIDLGAGNDTLSTSGFDAAVAQYWELAARLGPGNDTALGGPFPNLIYGGPGRDLIQGGPFNDRLFGGGQNDFLVGLAGRDLFQCGTGPDDRFNDGPGKDLVNVATCERRLHGNFVP